MKAEKSGNEFNIFLLLNRMFQYLKSNLLHMDVISATTVQTKALQFWSKTYFAHDKLRRSSLLAICGFSAVAYLVQGVLKLIECYSTIICLDVTLRQSIKMDVEATSYLIECNVTYFPSFSYFTICFRSFKVRKGITKCANRKKRGKYLLHCLRLLCDDYIIASTKMYLGWYSKSDIK